MICREYESPVGKLALGVENGALVRLWLPGLIPEGLDYGDDPVLEQAAAGLDCFFGGKPLHEELPILLQGTPFQKDVWQYLTTIPRGETRTYQEVAHAIGRPRAVRAVGAACGSNPVPLLVPCHRVVSAQGLRGYAGGLAMKEALLSREKDF